jgi:iron only hydrogenase large subunit-like protein
MTAMAEAKEWLEAKKAGVKKTTSCCPSFKLLVEKHFPELVEHVSETVSPMCGVSRLIKENYEDAVTVFVGPCIGKKAESASGEENSADYALTYGEIRAMLRAKDVKLEPEEDTEDQSSLFGKKFANAGGVTAAVLESMKELGCEDEVSVCKCDGVEACKKALTLLKFGKIPEDFIEGMACVGGCVGGPSRHRDPNLSMRDRKTALDRSTERNISENLAEQKADKVDMERR